MDPVLLETRPPVSNIVFLRPEVLWLALGIPLLLLAGRRLAGLTRLRRSMVIAVEGVAMLLLLAALAQPVLPKPDQDMNLVLVLDSSASLSPASRAQARTYTQDVLAGAGPTDHVRVVAADSTARLLSPADLAGDAWPDNAADGGAASGGTDLAAGLRLAGSLLPDSGRRRVVLLSDGWETQGRAADEAARLQARGIDLNVVALQALGDPEVVAQGLAMPAYARVGDALSSDLTVLSTRATSATVQVRVDGQVQGRQSVTLPAGTSHITLDQQAQTPGFHRVDVTVNTAADSTAANNTTSASVVVKPAPHVLVLEDRAGEAANLASALTARGMAVDVGSPDKVPAQAGGLDQYDSVILNNVAATSLTLDQQRTVQEYVRRHGGGLVTVGGRTSYARGGYADSVFEEVLPVSSQPPPRPAQGTTALILIIDRSYSMNDRSVFDDGVTKLAMARQAAQLAVDALREGDILGVLAFDMENIWAVPPGPIQSAADKERAKRLISEIRPGGGTSIHPAVEEAARTIEAITAPTKHLVLLTDGREFGYEDYGPVLSELQKADVSLSTIGIGSDTDQELLTQLAKLGQGRYYFTERPQNIPKIVFKELDLAMKEPLVEGAVQPQLLVPSPVLRGFAPQDLPQLRGYERTTAKDTATVGLVTDQGEPLLAQWSYGLGRVVAFTSDAGPGWAGPWLLWDEFARFWDQAVRWSMPSPVEPQLQPAITVSRPAGATTGYGVAHLTVESLHADNSFADLANLTAAVRAPSGTVTTTVLAQTAPGRYEGDLPLAEPGAYEARFTRRETGQTVSETAGYSVPPGPELLHAGTNDPLLQTLAAGKAYLTTAAAALDRQGLTVAAPGREPLWSYFLVPALLLLLVGVAVRRLYFPRRRVGAATL
jgi:uncharacterized membrane protein/Mg-chelatase subunit ChlD